MLLPSPPPFAAAVAGDAAASWSISVSCDWDWGRDWNAEYCDGSLSAMAWGWDVTRRGRGKKSSTIRDGSVIENAGKPLRSTVPEDLPVQHLKTNDG